jgi:hypothetical protein
LLTCWRALNCSSWQGRTPFPESRMTSKQNVDACRRCPTPPQGKQQAENAKARGHTRMTQALAAGAVGRGNPAAAPALGRLHCSCRAGCFNVRAQKWQHAAPRPTHKNTSSQAPQAAAQAGRPPAPLSCPADCRAEPRRGVTASEQPAAVDVRDGRRVLARERCQKAY